jgi:hypothetical protein
MEPAGKGNARSKGNERNSLFSHETDIQGGRSNRLTLEQANNLGNKRDEAIHAPCSFFTDHEGTEVGADFLSRHRRARSLTGKQLLIEFAWLERYTEALYSFTQAASLAMSVGNPTWPQRPSVPNRRPKKILQGGLRRLPLE